MGRQTKTKVPSGLGIRLAGVVLVLEYGDEGRLEVRFRVNVSLANTYEYK